MSKTTTFKYFINAIVCASSYVMLQPTLLAETLLSEDFERPTISGYLKDTIPESWTRSTGFNGTWQGLIGKDSGKFSPLGDSHQGYVFRYGGHGITTNAGTIDQLKAGVTYSISFDVVKDQSNNGVYRMMLEMTLD